MIRQTIRVHVIAGLLAVQGMVRMYAGEPFTVGPAEIIATAAQREALGLHTFVDGNLGILRNGEQYVLYGANGSQPVRVTGTRDRTLEKVEPVTLATTNPVFRYLSGGPVFRDPESGRLLFFYHAEIHRGTATNFYSLLGLAVQTDESGLAFNDLGPVFVPNVPESQASYPVEVCGAPYMIKDGYFYVYARDALQENRKNNLTVVRAPVTEVLQAARQGKPAEWRKYYQGIFSEPGTGGKSTPLENGNPPTRWMDITYNTALEEYLMIVAAPTPSTWTGLYITRSDDGIHWSPRKLLIGEEGEMFYISIIDGTSGPRQTGNAFDIVYTFSRQGEWQRWSDAQIIRRQVFVNHTR